MYYWLPNLYTKRYSQYINKTHWSGRAVERRNLKEVYREGGSLGLWSKSESSTTFPTC